MKNNPVRILQYIGSLNCGGSQSLIMNLYRNIDRSKIQFDFIVDRKDEIYYADEIKSLGGKIYYMNYYKFTNHFSFKKEWNNFFKNHNEYKIIHIHVRSIASLIIKIAHKYNIKTITHSHNTSNGMKLKSILKAIYQHKIRYVSDYFMGCSQKSCEYLFKKKVTKSNKCVVLNNSIDVDKYAFNNILRKRTRKDLGINDNAILLGFIGRLEHQKNPMFSLYLLNELIRFDSNFKLIIVGSGSLESKVLKYIDEHKLNDYVILLKDRNDINELMQAIDILLIPSIYEGLPLTLIEAQAASLKVIVSDNVKDGILNKKLVKVVKLDVNKWIKEVLKPISERKNQSNIIKEKGFDIKDSVLFIQNYYLNILKNKILFVSGSKNYGGAQRVITTLSNEMIKRNNVSIINTLKTSNSFLLDSNINEYLLDDSKKNCILKNVKRIFKLKKLIKNINPDVIISFLPEVSYRVIIANLFMKKKIFVSIRNNPKYEFNRLRDKILIKLLFNKVTGFIFQSNEAKNYFDKKIRQRSIVIYNPLDNNFICNRFNGNRKKEIVSVGRLEPQKNHLLLIKSFSNIKNKDYILKIYGDGSLKNKLQKYIINNNLENKVFLMGKSNNIKNDIYKSSLFVLTSEYEGMPNALFEAISIGIPSITINSFNNDLLKDNYNVIFSNEDDLASNIDKVLNDKKLSEKLSKNGCKIQKILDSKTICEEWIDFIFKKEV